MGTLWIKGYCLFLSLTIVSVEFRVWNEVTVKNLDRGGKRIIKAVTGFCGSSDAHYTCRTVPVSSKLFMWGKLNLCQLKFTLCALWNTEPMPKTSVGKRERQEPQKQRQRGDEEKWAALGPQLCASVRMWTLWEQSQIKDRALCIKISNAVLAVVSAEHELEPDSLSRASALHWPISWNSSSRDTL